MPAEEQNNYPNKEGDLQAEMNLMSHTADDRRNDVVFSDIQIEPVVHM